MMISLVVLSTLLILFTVHTLFTPFAVLTFSLRSSLSSALLSWHDIRRPERYSVMMLAFIGGFCYVIASMTIMKAFERIPSTMIVSRTQRRTHARSSWPSKLLSHADLCVPSQRRERTLLRRACCTDASQGSRVHTAYREHNPKGGSLLAALRVSLQITELVIALCIDAQ